MATKGLAQMGTETPNIVEATMEYRADFATPALEVWSLPGGMTRSVLEALGKWSVSLSDVTWNKDPNTLKDVRLSVNVPKLNSRIDVKIDSVAFSLFNPDWSKAVELVELLDTALANIQRAAKTQIASQDFSVAMHIAGAQAAYEAAMVRLINTDRLGKADNYGVAAYRDASFVVIDRSVRFIGAIYIKFGQKLSSSVVVSEIATIVYKQELEVLGLLGLESLVKGTA